MSRKAYNGYTEKSYYDNTKFSGMVATTDPLNEGNFRELINFDIEDTGASLKPRTGFLTTTIKRKDNLNYVYYINGDTSAIYSIGNNIYFIFDFSNNGYICFKVKLTYDNIHIDYNGEKDELEFYSHNNNNNNNNKDYTYVYLNDYDTTDFTINVDFNLRKITKVYNSQGFKMICYDGTYTVYPVCVTENNISRTEYLKIKYNEKKDEPILDNVNYNQQFSLTDNNIASNKSFINEHQVIYKSQTELGTDYSFVEKFPIIYVKDNNTNKHVTKFINQNNLNITVYPTFELTDFNPEILSNDIVNKIKLKNLSSSDLDDVKLDLEYSNEYTLAYAYKIFSTSEGADKTKAVYNSPVFDFNTNANLMSYIYSKTSVLANKFTRAEFSEEPEVYKLLDAVEGYANESSIFNLKSVIGTDSLTLPLTLELNEESIINNTNNSVLSDLRKKGYFENGLTISIYIIKTKVMYYSYIMEYLSDTLSGGIPYDVNDNIENGKYTLEEYKKHLFNLFTTEYSTYLYPDYIIQSAYLIQSAQIIKTTYIQDISYLEDVTGEYSVISKSGDSLVFNDVSGDRLIIWSGRNVYISDDFSSGNEGMFNYSNKKVFDEDIVKIIQFRDMLLVFTVQNIYAIYGYTDTTTEVVAELQDDGTTKQTTKTVEELKLAQMKVLYNVMCDPLYKDAIQVFNQMILFYSTDGQLFLIKPSTTIDSNTRFTIQYFNKSVNDILLNYNKYIQDRLEHLQIRMTDHGYDHDYVKKEDIKIKVTANINHIKIYYCLPDVITYILIYDVVNNYWKVYDTTVITDIKTIIFVEGVEVYFTKEQDKLYIARQYKEPFVDDSNSDMSFLYNYQRIPIQCLIDTGTLNLNNHLLKRFRLLNLSYKNLDAAQLGFTLDIIADDLLINNNIFEEIVVKDINSHKTYVVNSLIKSDELLDNYTERQKNELDLLKIPTEFFNIKEFTSNKILTQRSNIPCMAKAIRFRLHLVSKGVYKVISYGIIYKERSVK